MSAQPATQPATLSLLPPELLRKILLQATIHLSQPLLVHNQFTQLTTACKGCVYRSLAGVSHEWRSVVREIMGRKITLADGCGSEARDEEALQLVSRDKKRARVVREVDAGLRKAMCGWTNWPVSTTNPANVGEEGQSGEEAGLTTQGVEIERMREQGMNRERQRLYRLLSQCNLVDTLDVDAGFYSALHCCPTILPSTIRTLTLRNVEALETLNIVNSLPLLEDLTLRLALDWFLPPNSCPVGTCRLKRFELSTTAFGTTSIPSVLTLLDSSHDTLTSLTLRNKGASPPVADAFRHLGRGLIETFAGRLEELVVKDIPRYGMRPPGVEPSPDWLPSRPTLFPHLQHLHLTGLPLPSLSLFTHSIVLPPSQRLSTLILEDFDALSAAPLLEALRSVPALAELEELRVAFAREVEMDARDGEGQNEAEGGSWRKEKEEAERWCEGKGRMAKTSKLQASWKMVKVSGCGFW